MQYNFGTAGRGLSTPAVNILATFPPPQKDKPVLLQHSHITTLAYELGHAIQTFTRGNLQGMPWDSVEIASHLVQRLASEPTVQRELSPHYVYEQQEYVDVWKASAKPLPPRRAPLELLQKSSELERSSQILSLMETLWLSKFDLMLHSHTEEQLDSVDLGVECQRVLREWTGICGADDSPHGQARNNTYIHYSCYANYYTSSYCYL